MTMNWIETDGGTLAVEVRGAGPLVLCSPAMGDTCDAFDALAARLVDAGYRTAQVDLRGHGDSSTGFDRYGDDATADDLIAVLDRLGDGVPAVVIGASMSAAAAVIAAGRRPDLVRAVVLVAPFLRNGSGGAMMRLLFHAMLLRPWGRTVWHGYSKRLWPGLGADGASERAATNLASITRPGRWRPFVRTAHTDHRVVGPWLRDFGTPALVVAGTADPDWKDPVAEASWVADRVHGRRVRIDGAGHAPMLERPDEVARATIEFLGEVPDASGRA
ncbi:alpha/beta fold hydrolase [Curtobacterium sp. Leaf261]|uniref:alpha/beta fold hydrolase n=1 Tax=Curtobacterium sp. Leaf261 TaxID=1736311 RepID=UPI0006F97C22|nr:alpha/beta hydrolase [Curtobacterium sp. Leaf261]KQO63656.1 hydrolase [Curtobacterium sp. Leaf261]